MLIDFSSRVKHQKEASVQNARICLCVLVLDEVIQDDDSFSCWGGGGSW